MVSDPSLYYKNLLNPFEYLAFKVATRYNKTEVFFHHYETKKPALNNIAVYRDRHRGERCFILGGGPSLKKIDPLRLRNEVTFGVNGIFLIFDWLGFQPTYYCVEDWLVIYDRSEEINHYVTESECFLPIQWQGRNVFQKPNHQFLRLIYDYKLRHDWPKFSLTPEKLVWAGGTVAYICLQLAFLMGFKEVYLVGFDHYYRKPSHVTTNGTEWTSHGTDPNHFHGDYFGAGKRWHDPRLDRMELGYRKAKAVYERDGRVIYNATEGGKLNIFERRAFASIFS